MPSIYENPEPRRNIDYRPGTIVGAGRLWPEERIEPRIARMGTDKKSRSWSWSSSVISVLSVVNGLFIKAAESAPARRDIVQRMSVCGTGPHQFTGVAHPYGMSADSSHILAVSATLSARPLMFAAASFLHLAADVVKWLAPPCPA